MPAEVYKSEDGYSIRGLEPPGMQGQSAEVRLMFWKWVLELGLKAKDQDTAAGLDKDGKALKSISEYTRKHRKSAMTPSGKGDPNAPPLTPGWQKSRTRSLLTGRAYVDHVDFFWKYDSHLGDSWARALDGQVDQGRDVFGLSPKSLAKVQKVAWQRFNALQAGKRVPAPAPKPAPPRYRPIVGPAIKTVEEWRKFFRQEARVKIPGRKGPFNIGLVHDWAKPMQAPPKPLTLPDFLKKTTAPVAARTTRTGIAFQTFGAMLDWFRKKSG